MIEKNCKIAAKRSIHLGAYFYEASKKVTEERIECPETDYAEVLCKLFASSKQKMPVDNLRVHRSMQNGKLARSSLEFFYRFRKV